MYEVVETQPHGGCSMYTVSYREHQLLPWTILFSHPNMNSVRRKIKSHSESVKPPVIKSRIFFDVDGEEVHPMTTERANEILKYTS